MEKFTNAPQVVVKTLAENSDLADVQVKMLDHHIFFGIGRRIIPQTLEQRLSERIGHVAEASDVQTLFELRRDLAFIRMIYSSDAKPEAVVRLFGMCDESGVLFVKHCFPRY